MATATARTTIPARVATVMVMMRTRACSRLAAAAATGPAIAAVRTSPAAMAASGPRPLALVPGQQDGLHMVTAPGGGVIADELGQVSGAGSVDSDPRFGAPLVAGHAFSGRPQDGGTVAEHAWLGRAGGGVPPVEHHAVGRGRGTVGHSWFSCCHEAGMVLAGRAGGWQSPRPGTVVVRWLWPRPR